MQIKVLVDFKDGRDEFIKDDKRTVTAENGEYFCANGWAEDVSGEVPTGTIDINEVRLDIRNVRQAVDAENVGG